MTVARDKALDIAFVTVEFEGPTRNGGIGTACRELAMALVAAGHRVTVFFAGPFHQYDGAYWRHALKLDGIEFTALDADGIDDYYQRWPEISRAARDWLRARHFDVIHFHDWLAYGLDTTRSKRSGDGFRDAVLCATLHGPTHWVELGNDAPTLSPERQRLSLAEQASVEASNVVFSPSRFLLAHLYDQGWRIPETHFVRQNVLGRDHDDEMPVGQRLRVTEFVFFGRLEKLKGLDLFCDALDHLDAGEDELRLTFLGRVNTIHGEDAIRYIERRARRWRAPWRIISDMARARALDFLSVPGRCAVMPSRLENSPYSVLECLARGIPFLASHVGGTPELIRADMQDETLFENTPEALLAMMRKVRAMGVVPAVAARPFQITRQEWQAWHSRENIDALLNTPGKPGLDL
jgi:glycosyltransferase involved in cell wall biosynthesis